MTGAGTAPAAAAPPPSRAARARLERIFRAALAAVEPARLVRDACSVRAIAGPLRVVAAGKGAAPMAKGLLEMAGDGVLELLVVTKEGHGLELAAGRDAAASRLPSGIDLREAGHPLPDVRSAAAGRAARALAARCQAGESLVVLLSGGASALLTEPQPGLSQDDLIETTRVLLEAGADIHVLNSVRKHLTRVSGGRLARAAHGADRIVVLGLSDVPGDDPSTLASGPCSPDPTRFVDAVEGARACAAWPRLPAAVRAHLEAGVRGEVEETPKPDPAVGGSSPSSSSNASSSSGWDRVELQLLGSNATALRGAEEEARRLGLQTLRDPIGLTGEAREAGHRLACARPPGSGAPALVLAGGETTVHVRGPGRGGRSQEVALAAALRWAAAPPDGPVTLLAAGTDGTDGPTDAAGAFADAGTVRRGIGAGRSAAEALADNDAYGFFRAEGGLFVTGPTRTNVMDLVLIEWGGAAVVREPVA